MGNHSESGYSKPIYKRVWFWIIIIVIIVAVATNKGGKSQQTNSTPEEKTITAVGQTLTTQYFKVTVESIEKPTGSAYNKPSEGKEFVQVNLDIENISNEDYNISSILMFNAYCDGYSINQSISAAIAKGESHTMDGALAAGKKIKGALSYELPKDWKELEIDADLTTLKFSNDGKIKIKLQNQ